MSKSTQIQGTKVTETFSNFDEGISPNIRASYGVGDVGHGFVYKDKIIPRVGIIDNTPDGTGGTTPMEGRTLINASIRRAASYPDSNPRYAGLLKSLDESEADLVIKKDGFNDEWETAHTLTKRLVANTPMEDYSFDFLYMVERSATLSDLASSDATTSDEEVETGFQVMQGTLPFVFVYHPEYDNLYILEKAAVSEIDGGTINRNVLSLSQFYTLTAGCAYSSFLAMGQYDQATESSTALIWNVDTDSPYIETIPWGAGEIIAMAELDGALVGVTIEVNASSGGLRRMVGSRFNGSFVEPISEILGDNAVFGDQYNVIQPFNDGKRLYFMGLNSDENRNNYLLSIDRNGVIRKEIVNQEQSNNYNCFLKENNRFTIGAGSPGKIYISDNTSYNQETFVTSLACNANSPHITKTLKEITVAHSPIPSGGSVKIEYKDLEGGSWIVAKTNTTEGEARTSIQRNIESDKNFPQYRELLVRVTTTGGVTILPFKVVSEMKSDDKINKR